MQSTHNRCEAKVRSPQGASVPLVELVGTAHLKCADESRAGSSPAGDIGSVVEWFMALVLKTRGVKASVGSNPTTSVEQVYSLLALLS